jgi:hypothetical protein
MKLCIRNKTSETGKIIRPQIHRTPQTFFSLLRLQFSILCRVEISIIASLILFLQSFHSLLNDRYSSLIINIYLLLKNIVKITNFFFFFVSCYMHLIQNLFRSSFLYIFPYTNLNLLRVKKKGSKETSFKCLIK